MKKITLTSHSLWPFLWVILYLTAVGLFLGLRMEHFVLSTILLLCYYGHPKTKAWISDFFPFALFGMLYDFLRVYPKEWAGTVHVVWPYELEKMLFGIPWDVGRITPNEFFRLHPSVFLDVFSGFFYSSHIAVPIAFALFLWIKHRNLGRRFIQAFFIVNMLAFVTYVALPVAPPWYVEIYGLVPANWNIPGCAAGLVRCDTLLGMPYFQSVYARNAWPFGAIPSMHCGYQVLNILYARRFPNKRLIWLFYGYLIGMVLSAVYLRHHYIIDLLAGAIYAFVTYHLVELWHRKKTQNIHPPQSS